MFLFDHPHYLLAALLALVPILVYGVPYLRVRERSFPALHFLLRRYPTRFQRFRSLNRVIIAVRVSLILAIVVLFTAPTMEERARAPGTTSGSPGLLLVVSNSVEMSRSTPAGTYLDLALAKASSWLEQSDNERIMVVGTCTGLTEETEWGDRAAALSRLRGLRQSWAWCPAGPVVEAARGRWSRGELEIIVLASEEGAEPSPELFHEPGLVRISLGTPEDSPAGPGATLLSAAGVDGGLRVAVSLRGEGAELSARCSEGEGAVATVQVEGPGLSTVLLELDVARACVHGWWELSLSPDGLDADDHLWIPAPGIRTMDVLLVDGGFGGRLEERRTRFLEPALRALDQEDLPLRLRVLSQEELTSARIDAADLVILADPHPLRPHLRRSLSAHLDSGGGLMVTAGPRLARWREGQGLLPGAWRSAEIAKVPGPGIELSEGDHPALAVLLGTTQAQGRGIGLRRRLILSKIGGGDAESAASFDDGVPAVVRWRQGRGIGFLWAMSADLSFGDLPLHAAFPLLLGAQVREVAAGIRFRGEALRCEVGTPCPVTDLVPPGWELQGPGATSSPDIGVRLALGELSLEPGPYSMVRGEERRLAAVLDLTMEARLALGAEPDRGSAEPGALTPPTPAPTEGLSHRRPVRSWLALLAMLLLMFEGWVALRQ